MNETLKVKVEIKEAKKDLRRKQETYLIASKKYQEAIDNVRFLQDDLISMLGGK